MTAKILERKHYWCASITIEFVHEEKALTSTVMAMTQNEDPWVTENMLRNLQVQAQIQLSKNLGELPDVKNVIINSINFLGHMTEDDFRGTNPEKA